jgi:VWFA-related protein
LKIRSYFAQAITISIVAFAFLLALKARAQSSSQPPDAAQNPPPGQVLRAVVRLIQVTVVAEDGYGRPVSDLKLEDLTLRDKGEPQKLSYFSQQNTPAFQQSPVSRPGSAPNFYSNHVESSPEGANSVTILLLDALNTQFRDLSYARTRVINFLQHMQPQDQVALYVLTPTTLYVMHDFTNDSPTLVRLMGGKPEKASTSSTASAPPSNPHEIKIEKLMSDSLGESNRFYKGRPKNIVDTTQNAMLQIARNTVNIPGRKNLVWISGGFPTLMGTAIPMGARDDGQDFTAALSTIAKNLGDANVAVYPVDARGLFAPRGGHT